MRAHWRSGNRPKRSAGMRGGMHKNVRANPRVRKNKTYGVVDASRGQLVGIEKQRGNRKTGGVGAGALITPSRRRINAIEVPHHEAGCGKCAIRVVGLISFVEFSVAPVGY